MAFNKVPTTWIPDWSEDGTDISVPIASFPELTAAEADAATGDIRKICFALCKKLSDAWYALAAADRPAKMSINRSISVDSATGIQTQTISFTFKTSVLTQEVADEA